VGLPGLIGSCCGGSGGFQIIVARHAASCGRQAVGRAHAEVWSQSSPSWPAITDGAPAGTLSIAGSWPAAHAPG
ncbi:MAG: hypothetical protein CMF11_01335, partial [Idiomarina sp.]|nr:hypothetical protein [Idiomarina sp.]